MEVGLGSSGEIVSPNSVDTRCGVLTLRVRPHTPFGGSCRDNYIFRTG